jgi:PAS domain S-box-containing protein
MSMWKQSTNEASFAAQERLNLEDDTGISLPTPKILIVDDTPANLLAFEAALEPLGYEVVKANSGFEALRYLLAMEFSLILMDVQMPIFNGIETVKLIKQSKRHRYIPILFITAICRSMSFVLEGYEAGAIDYILKPCEPTILRSKVIVLVELFRQQEIVKRQAALLRQHEREAMARRTELRFEALIESMPICVWAAHANGEFYYSNTAWSLYAGPLTERNVAKSLLNAVHPDDRDNAWTARRDALARLCSVDVQVRLRRGDGVYRWHLVRAVPQREEEDHVTGWIITATDIDEQKRAEEAEALARKEAESTNREIMTDEFLATVSHELRTPLTSLVGWSSLLSSGALNAQKTELGIASIARNAEAERRVVNDILDVSRIATGRLLVHFEPINPAAIVDDVVEALEPLAKTRGITFESTVESSGILMMGDPDRLWQVVSKLVGNAIKFTPAGGRVDVSLEHRGDRFVLTISDTGEGIPPDVLPQIFGYFSQEDRSMTRKHGGLGLGLAIVGKLVELHGGTITATSAGKGHGATFTATLPSCAATLSHKAPMDADSPRHVFDRRALTGVRVLLVTADIHARMVMAEVLERRGATVLSVASAEDAVALVAESVVDVVVGDWGVKGVDEPVFSQRLRSIDDRALALIAVTEAAEREHTRKAFSAGFHGSIAKPIHPAHLVAAIASFGLGSAERHMNA